MKIKYHFVTGETSEIEVEENLYNEMREITKQMNTINKKEQRKRESIDTAIEDGKVEFVNDNENLHKRKLREKLLDMLPTLLETLNERQKDLLARVFFHGQSLQEISADYGIKYQSVQDQLKVIYKNLKKLLQK